MRGILLNESGDLAIVNKSLQIGDSTQDVTKTILMSCPGHMKHAPTIGVDIISLVNDNTPPVAFYNRTKVMLKKELIQVSTVSFSNGKLIIK